MVYVIYGFKAPERELGNAGMKGEEQREKPETVEIYRTHDETEARGILQNGGFVKDDAWHVARHVETQDEFYTQSPAVSKDDV